VVNRSHAESNVTSIEATVSDISTVHKHFCLQIGWTGKGGTYPRTFDWQRYLEIQKGSWRWCGNGPRRRGRRRKSWPDCAGSYKGCVCGYNIDQPEGGSWAVYDICDVTKCGWNAVEPGKSGLLQWRGSLDILVEMTKCTLYGTY